VITEAIRSRYGVLLNSARRRLEEYLDQAAVRAAQPLRRRLPPSSFDGDARISVLTVSYNTLRLTKLMLLTLAESWCFPGLKYVVIVDNGSKDGSAQFLRRLAVGCKCVRLVEHRWPSSHASGLRCGMQFIGNLETALPENERTNLCLIVDSDVIFLATDLFRRMVETLVGSDAGLVGEVQWDVGEAYVHPCCMLLRRACYEDDRVFPFINHGAPALWLERSMKKAGMKIANFPVLSESLVVHRGRGTVDALPRFAPLSSYGSGRYYGAHFHGNKNGRQLWMHTESRFEFLLSPDHERDAIEFIGAHLSSVHL